MKPFLDENFLLTNSTAELLYHEFARQMPVIDYHCHLSQALIASDHWFKNLTQAWLHGDHYKWRAMRANGINEKYITGDASDVEKFQKWAETVPYTMRNPLYHWTHLELQRYFGITTILNGDTAKGIYEECSAKLQSAEYSVRNLLRKMNVKLVCTTDDPVDDLQHHIDLSKDDFEISVLPAFRPDHAMNVDSAVTYNSYLQRLEIATDTSITTYSDLLSALQSRHDFFAAAGCSVSDHGLEHIYAEDYTTLEIEQIFSSVRSGKELSLSERNKFKSAMLVQFAEWDWEKSWVQQYHLGAMRNNNSRMLQNLGPDTGWDSIGDYSQGTSLSKFLNKLDKEDKLARTILYNMNPNHNALFATMTGNFNDGSAAGKIQFGSGWWFLDQKDGMIEQLNALSNMGLLSRFVGMLTDSRSFLSFPRHEYFRRILCNLFGGEIEAGELPNDIKWIGKVIQNISYTNAKNYFNWQYLDEKITEKASLV
ncbi:MAG: glucuronate isomerase [Chitinophagaceae bacterium]|nr:glucuronate isomerase [Chitinophagaceae bacterium]